MKNAKKWLALALAAGMTVSALAGCGGSSDSSSNTSADTAQEATESTDATETSDADAADTETADTAEADAAAEPTGELHEATIKYMLAAGENSYYYESYNDNPAVKYWLDKEWNVDGERWKVNVEFEQLPAGAEKDTMTTLYATAEYSDVMPMAYATETVSGLYEQGVALDLTEYVNKYMPNYLSWLDTHEAYANRLTNHVNGENLYLQLYSLNDVPENPFAGWMYRRDWIVKYGKDADGNGFTGGWQDEEKTVWEDDVVFPSGNTDPVYISDWEWMLDIFQTALKEEGIDDGYAFQLYYMGDDTQGTLTSSFVYGGNSYYYLDEDGVAQCGLKTDGYRAYIECMKEWYDKGWTDPYFEEHTSDIMFWKVDTEKVYSGKVGLLYSGVGSLGNRTATEDQPDLCLYGASYPINDIYGDEDCKNNEPTCFFGNGVISNSVIITEKINKEYLPAFLTALDYLYGEEGATLRAFGFSDEEQAELQDDFYNEWGLEDGAYTVEERDGEKIYVINQAVYADDNLQNAAKLTRVVGAGINGPVDFGYDETYAAAINLYKVYLNSGNIDSVITGQMTAEQQDETSANTANIRTYVSMEVPNFITGRTDISSDSDWQAFCDGIDNYNPMVYVDYVNEVLGN